MFYSIFHTVVVDRVGVLFDDANRLVRNVAFFSPI